MVGIMEVFRLNSMSKMAQSLWGSVETIGPI